MALARRPVVSRPCPVRYLPRLATGAALWASLLTGAAGADSPAHVQTAQLGRGGEPGIVKATAYAPVTPGLAIAVKPFDDNDLNLAVKARLERELARIKRSVSETAVLVLSFETRVVEGEFSGRPGTMGRFQAGTEDTRLELNVWSSTRDSLLGGRVGTETRRGNVFHLNAVLRDQRTGKTLWQADAYCAMVTGDSRRIALSMARPLALSLGRSVDAEPFEIE